MAYYVYNKQLAACADAEGWAPERDARHDVGVHIAPLAVAMTLLEEVVGEEVKWKYLTAMRMS